MFQRPHFQALAKRLDEPRMFMQVLAGPRQVGKTTLVGQLLEANTTPSHNVSADGLANAGAAWLDQQWETARIKHRQSGAPSFILAIDEIQKIPNWSETVKANWDADTRNSLPINVVLLGSSRLLLQQGLTESLAGRFELTYIGHWSFLEMKEAFGFSAEQFAWFGGYPGASQLIGDELRWKKYVTDALIEPSISRDILSLTRVDKPALLRRLFELGCLYSGQVVALNKLLGQLLDAGNVTTLAHYLTLLDSAGLLGGLEKYSGAIIRQRQSSPKFQVHNTALIGGQAPEILREIKASPEKWGRIVESAVGAHLLNHAREEGYQLTYWREGNHEVDFVVQHRGKMLAIEVKSGSLRNTTGMEAFRKSHSPDKLLLVGKDGLPWEEFLEVNPVDLF
ncbi:MAG: ATP-binding protein [Saprospiraceae bacterium]|nr:ATP-binding protein [Saprospiraceae bacterium]MCF8251349.1 ATP-binding protein [Saprospiraceae bacterium]MCF8280524.1 ATP-binding protein [Bacteroidales bacterium]MCF8313258.1 ATP-binding protein [Saprospiraceae bacterium]MCF8441705.1 ATP-binding protein [Saprospiraceae bacterium]